jgi:RNA polymerase sigma-70 factor (ECF subfamily)
VKVEMAWRHPQSAEAERPADEAPDDAARELELVRRAQAGDGAAFRALFETWFHFVLRTCCSLGLSGADAEDALQDTFIVADRQLRTFSGGSLAAWLHRIAANVVSARHRRNRVRQALFSLWAPREGAPVERPDRLLEAEQAREDVARVLSRMTPKKREVFALFELEGLSGEEIAARVGCPVNTVWTRLFHARRDFERLAREERLIDEDPP